MIRNILKRSPEHFLLTFSGALLCLYVWWIAGREDASLISAHDYLDSIFLYNVVRARQEGFFFDFSYLIPQFSDLPLNSLALRDLGIGENLYMILEPFYAYSVNYALAVFSAFAGFYLLGRDYFLKDKKNALALITLIILAYIYAIIPHKPQRLLGVTMLPLLYWAGANIWFGRKMVLSWLVWLFYPFYAFLHYNGFAVCLGLGIFCTGLLLFKRDKFLRFLALTSAFGLLYAFVEIRSLLIVLSPSHKFESLRSNTIGDFEWSSLFSDVSLSSFLDFILIFNGHHHIANNMDDLNALLWMVVLAAIVGITGLLFYRKRKEFWQDILARLRTPAVLIALYILIGSLAFLDTRFHLSYHLLNIPLPLNRIDTLSFPLLLIASAALLNRGGELLKGYWTLLPPAVALLLLAGTVADSLTTRYQIYKDIGRALPQIHDKYDLFHPLQMRYSMKEYFLEDNFRAMEGVLDKRIGTKSSYRTLSIGFSPTKAQYNGFYTLDGYFYNYPFSMYETLYWPVVLPAFALDGKETYKEALAKYSSRLYAPLNGATNSASGQEVTYDWCAFTRNQGRVIFSAHPVANAFEEGLDFVGQFGPVYLYDVLKEKVCRRASEIRKEKTRF